jgi:hypothetical protein
MAPIYPPKRDNVHSGLDHAGASIHLDVVGLTTRLQELDRRISQVKERQLLLDARTAASILDAAGQY